MSQLAPASQFVSPNRTDRGVLVGWILIVTSDEAVSSALVSRAFRLSFIPSDTSRIGASEEIGG